MLKETSQHGAPRAFRDFAAVRQLHAIGTSRYPWIEIDFPEDDTRAVEEVFPEVWLTDERLSKIQSLSDSASALS